MVKRWDLLLVREREDKHAQLLQRLELQRRLIAKNNLLSKLAKKEAEEKHRKVCSYITSTMKHKFLQELQSRRDIEKQMIQSLRIHNQRST